VRDGRREGQPSCWKRKLFRVVFRERPPGRSEGASSGVPDASGSRTRARMITHHSLSDRISDQDTMLRENPRTGPGGCPDGAGSGSSEPGHPRVWKSRNPRGARARRVRLLRVGRVGTGSPVSRRAPEKVTERQEAHESIGRGGPRSAAGTDLRREQGPGAAGHRDLLVLRAGARDVRNSMRVQAPRGVRLCGGVKLWRAQTP
jgi:hypothetical protein